MNSQLVEAIRDDPTNTSTTKKENVTTHEKDEMCSNDQCSTSQFFLTAHPECLAIFCNVDVQFGKVDVMQEGLKVPSLTKSCQIDAEQNPFK